MFTSRCFVRMANLGLAALLLLAGVGHAAPVPESTARLVASNFIANHIAVHGSWNGAADADILAVELVQYHGTPVAYHVSVRPSGHVLVAYDDDFSPVLLYSDQSSFDPARVNEADAVESWIIPEILVVHQDLQKRQRDYGAANPASLYKSQSRSASAWTFFNRHPADFSPLVRAGKSKPVLAKESAALDAAVAGPLLSTTWSQGSPKTAPFTYNLYTPADSGCTHAYTGCVATATAQLMKYWNWPDIGTGSHSYTWTPPSGASSQTLSASFSHAYNWSSMPASLSSSSSASQIDAVARLMSDVGIANGMNYGCDSSGSNTESSATHVLPTYFKYKNTVQSVWRTSYTAPAFFAAIKAEIDAVPPRPALYRMSGTAGGHAVVADGYQTGATDMVHINMGWGGSYNGYYDISNNWTTGTMTWTATSQAAFTNIQPNSTTPCSYSISPTSQSVSASATTGTISMTAGSACAWTATSNASWISITSGSSGSGSGTVVYSVAANTGTSMRSGTLTVGGQTFTVTQAGASCSYSLAPTSLSAGASASTASASVTAGASCAWTASSNATWLTITSGSSGSGSGTVNFSVAANTVSGSRSGTLTIGGKTLSVTQAGANCSYTITPTSQSLGAAAANGMVSVSAGYACPWTATSNASWISITSGSSGSGEGIVSYSASANTGTSSRSGTLSIAGQTLSVTQAGYSSATTNFLNPGFENGVVNWTESGAYAIITNDATLSHSGNWVAWLGGYDYASDILYQSVTIPVSASQAKVQFWYWIYTEETSLSTAYDTLTITIENAATSAVLATQTLSNLNASPDWLQSAALDVSAYAGQTIRLRFVATTDNSLTTSFFIDDISLIPPPTSGWTALPGASPSRPSLALNSGTGKTQMVVRSASDQLWMGNFNASGAFEGWNPLPGASPSSVAQAWHPGVNKMFMVVRSASDQLYLGTFNSAGSFEGWNALPGASPSPVALAWHPTLNKMFMVVRSASNQLYLGTFNSAGSFEGWSALSGASPSPVALAWHPTLNKMFMVARSASDQLYLGTFNSAGSFEGWSALSGASPSPVALAWHPTLNKMFMAARSANDKLWQGTFSSTSGTFEGWSALSGTSPTAPVLAAGQSNLQLVVRSANDQLWSMLLQ